MPERAAPCVVVLGLGNVLLSDDGVGVAAAHRLRQRCELPPGVEVLDGGTLGLSLLPYIEHAAHLLLLDAVRSEGRAPGTVLRLEGDEVPPAVAHRLSPHQIGVADLLTGAVWLERYPGSVTLLGVVPEHIELGTARTPAVEAAVPALVDAAIAELEHIGFPPRPMAGADAAGETGERGEGIDVARILEL